MRYFHLLWKNVWRKKAQTLFTIGAIAAAFVLFGLLGAIERAFSMGVDVSGADRMVTIHKVSLIQPLPLRYREPIRTTPGVVDSTHVTWFGGYYQDARNIFPQFAVEAESYLRLFPEIVLSEEQKKAWFEKRTAAVVGRDLAERYEFEVGDRIPLQATIWRHKDGSRLWEFEIAGIFDGSEQGVETNELLFHYDYFNEGRAFAKDMVGWYVVRIDDPQRAAEIAEAVDRRFMNSPFETKTTTEAAFAQGFANQVGNISSIVRIIVQAVFVILLLVTGNAMAHSVRERLSELALLKTLGFTNRRILGLVLAESCTVACMGGLLGLGAAWFVIGRLAGVDVIRKYLEVFYLPPEYLAVGIALTILLGIAAGLLPALRARGLQITDALRRV